MDFPGTGPVPGAQRRYREPPLRGGRARCARISWRRHNLGGRTAQRALAAHSMDLLHATESAVALDKCQNRIRPFGGVSRFQREQAMNEDIDLSIWRAPMESAIYRAARSIGQLASKEAVDY